VLAALDALRELHLLRGREERDLADVLEEELQRVGRDLGRGRGGRGLRLGLVLVRVDDGDLRLVERGVELVELRRLEVELVEREGDLVRVEPPRLQAGLEQALRLVRGENVLDRRLPGRAALRFPWCQTAPLPRRPSHGSRLIGGRQRSRRLRRRPATGTSTGSGSRERSALSKYGRKHHPCVHFFTSRVTDWLHRPPGSLTRKVTE
jgi:hypothetical protein